MKKMTTTEATRSRARTMPNLLLKRARSDPLLYSRRVIGSAVNDVPRLGAYFALFSEIGLVLLVTTLAGALAGHWLDEQLGTVFVFVVIGFLGGAAIGAIGIYRL